VTLGDAVAVAFLAIMVVLILRGVRGHVRSAKTDEEPGVSAAIGMDAPDAERLVRSDPAAG
jgi:hypothetical protein